MQQFKPKQIDMLSSVSAKKKHVAEFSGWQLLEERCECKFGMIKNPKRIIDSYRSKHSLYYKVEEDDGQMKLVPDIILEERFPQFLIKHFENMIEFQ